MLDEPGSEVKNRHDASGADSAVADARGGGVARRRGALTHHRQRSIAMLEREVKSLSERVEQLEREKAAVEAFAAVAAHELVEPLVMTEAYATDGERSARTPTSTRTRGATWTR